MRDISAGLDLIKRFEGCRPTAYQDAAGLWTIGWGHRGPEVVSGLTWTQEEADDALEQDAASACQQILDEMGEIPLADHELSALTSFVYNLGISRFKSSQLLKFLLAENFDQAADEFMRWIHVAGKPSQGLIDRRKAEMELFLDE